MYVLGRIIDEFVLEHQLQELLNLASNPIRVVCIFLHFFFFVALVKVLFFNYLQ